MPDPDGNSPRIFGLTSATALVVASMVGSGIFGITGLYAANVGTPANLLLPWLLGAILALCGALSLAELGAAIPCSGGTVAFVRRAFGDRLGYLTGMVTLLAGYIFSVTLVALFLAGFLEDFLPGEQDDRLLALVAIALACGVQLFGVRAGVRLNDLLAVAKVLLIGGLIAAGVLAIPTVGETPPGAYPSPLSGPVAQATLSVSFAYLGWSAVADVAGEVRSPGRTLPIAITLGVVSVAVLYLGLNLVYLRAAAPVEMVRDGQPVKDIGAFAMTRLLGPKAGTAVAAIISVSIFSTLVAGTIAAARVLERLAADRDLPRWPARRDADGSPRRAVAVVAVGASLGLLIGPLGELLDLIGTLVTIFSSLSVAAVLLLRRREPDLPRPFRVPFFPWPPLIYLGLSLWAIVTSAVGGGWKPLAASAIAVVALLAVRPLLRARDPATESPDD
jgi:APA family basic amino acid/polyamine antiporter